MTPASGATELDNLRRENELLKRKYHKALEMLSRYKNELETRLGIPPPPAAPSMRNEFDVYFSTDEEDEEGDRPTHLESRKILLKRYMEVHGRRLTPDIEEHESRYRPVHDSENIRSPDSVRESLDLAESLNGACAKPKLRPSLRLPLHERALEITRLSN
jgi:pyruvate/2-oxoacid:ferredoxin oxidoreductase alpha subunit